LNHISYFNKICRICCMNTHIQSLKVWLKSVLPWLKYSNFFIGDCFLLAHPVDAWINNGDDSATQSCRNLENFCLVTLEMTGLICVPICTCTGWKSIWTLSFVALPFSNAMEYWNADERINSGTDLVTSDINLVSFWPVPPEFTQINCVSQVSISTRVSLSKFARCQRSYFSLLYSLGGDTVTPWRRVDCHAF